MRYIILILLTTSCSQLTCYNKDENTIGRCSSENIFNATRCKTAAGLTACETISSPTEKKEEVNE